MELGVVISLILIAVIVGSASAYLVKAKKSGKKCIGCPYASSCSKKCSCNLENTDVKEN